MTSLTGLPIPTHCFAMQQECGVASPMAHVPSAARGFKRTVRDRLNGPLWRHKIDMPGDNITFDVELITPIAMEEKLRFAIREGGRTVGAGVVAKTTD